MTEALTLSDLRPVAGLDDLVSRYRPPSARAAGKVRDRIDPASAAFIGHASLVLLATADGEGRCDVSPRGGPPGFVAVLDEHHVALPDLGGNNRLDSYRNLVVNPRAGLLLVVPGRDETLRINGPAVLTDDERVLDRCDARLRRPPLALVVETAELFAHCAKAFRRASAWDPASWAAHADAPGLPEIYACQFEGVEAPAKRSELEQTYRQALIDDRADATS